ncbi:hypothetical protein [Nocardioides sp.]|uniref:hypothetical protein n=1 Tax=Nocardioides sp. TaxID=35761 RepID=UPI002BFA18AF|nr:hypothetical protein [Nocardioides sp.]HXH78780.1 hypothetical protein [Nocardioides sp.]
MSKMDGLRAMREAKHAEMVARSKTLKDPGKDSGSAAKKPVAPQPAGTATAKTAAKPQVAQAAAPSAAPADEPLCGHRNMSGRTCTREQGHAAKSHRYS